MFALVDSASSGTKAIGKDTYVSSGWVALTGVPGAKEMALEAANNNCAARGKQMVLKNLTGRECMLRGGCGEAEATYQCLDKGDPRYHEPTEVLAEGLSPALQKLLDAKEDARCKSFGAKSGTDAYINCRLRLQEIRSQSAGTQANPPATVTQSRTVCIRIPVFDTITTQCRQETN